MESRPVTNGSIPQFTFCGWQKSLLLFIRFKCIFRLIQAIKMRSAFLLLCILPLITSVKAQEGAGAFSTDAEYHHGYMLPEYQFINYLVNAPVQAVELSLFKQTTGRTIWEQLYRYPEYGMSVMYSTLGNHQALGEYISLWPWYRIHFIDNRNFSLNYKLGLGLCYATRVFDPENNYMNRAIGSALNIFFNLETGTRIRIYHDLWITSGIGFNHLSNANLREPNFGLNDLTFFAGINWIPSDKAERIVRDIPVLVKRSGYYITLSAAPKHKRSFEGNHYLVSSLSFDFNRQVFHKVKLGAGADIFYDASTKVEMEGRSIPGYRKLDDFRTGLHLSEEFVYDRLSLIFQEGSYFLLNDKVTGHKIYTRGIVQFRFADHLMARLSMKTHFFILDHPELGIGYCW